VSATQKLLSFRFVTVVTCGTFYFIALAMLTPVIPHYVKDDLGHGDFAVGIATGVFAVGSILLRLYFGRLGYRIGRRALIIFGASVVAFTTLMYGAVDSLAWLIVWRFATGFGEAAFFVGAATMVTDLAPVERRGEAISYWSIAVYSGLAFGPALGELLRGTDRYVLTFTVSAVLAGIAALLGLFTRDVPREPSTDGPSAWVHRAAIGPGVALLLGLFPLAGFTTFVSLYADEDLGIGAGLVFAVYGVLVLLIRIFGARLPDRLGGRQAGTIALAGAGLGIGIVALWPTIAGLYTGTIVFAIGMAFMYPALLLLTLDGVPDNERASAIGTFSSFFDGSQFVGPAVCGAVAALTGYRGAFAAGTVTALLGLFWLRSPRGARIPATS
jgi:MFS family permease